MAQASEKLGIGPGLIFSWRKKLTVSNAVDNAGSPAMDSEIARLRRQLGIDVGCWAHVRRKFKEIYTKEPEAEAMLRRIGRLCTVFDLTVHKQLQCGKGGDRR